MPKPKPFDAKKAVIRYLRSQVTAVVSTVTADGQPQAATVFFWVNDLDKDVFSLYFLTHRHKRKFQNLLANNRVAMVIGTEMAPSTVQIDGEAEIIDVADALGEMTVLTKLLKNHPTMSLIYKGAFFPKSPFKSFGKDYVFIRVKPTWVRWMRFNKANREIEYHQIIEQEDV